MIQPETKTIMFKNIFKKNINKLDYNTSKQILEEHKLDLYVTMISQKTNSRPRPYRDGYKLCCPAHDDRRASFTIWLNKNKFIEVKCFAKCLKIEICHAIGIEPEDLYPLNYKKSNTRKVKYGK